MAPSTTTLPTGSDLLRRDVVPTGGGTTIVLPQIGALGSITDTELTHLLAVGGAARRSVDAFTIAVAGEVARRSSRDRGHNGLAARNGLPNPEKLIQRHTGITFSEAKNLTGAATALDGDAPVWKAPIADAVRDGVLSAAGAAAIAAELSTAEDRVPEGDLLEAATALVDIATQATPEETRKAARVLRDVLDEAGVGDREEHRRSLRSVKWFVQADGMTRLTAILDPESAATVVSAIESILSPRRGPRFIEDALGKTDDARAEVDDRTLEQAAADALVDIIDLATRASATDLDPAKLFGDTSPAVRVHVTRETLAKGVGPAFIEGQEAAVSAATANRIICSVGVIPILFDSHHPIDVGRTQRLHSVKHRVAMAAQWGGCAWTGCSRPPSMTEAHHVERWNGTNTTLANGVPLCRFHHRQLHHGGWSITVRADSTHWLIPPRTVDHGQVPMRLRSKNPLSAGVVAVRKS